jgi:hypothetical protein
MDDNAEPKGFSDEIMGFAVILMILAGCLFILYMMLFSLWTIAGHPAQDQLEKTVENRIHSLTGSMPSVATEFLKTRVDPCVQKEAKKLFQPFRESLIEMAGYHGFKSPEPEVFQRYSKEIVNKCATEFVLSAASYKDALERNKMLEQAGLALFDGEESLASRLSF